MPDAHANFAYSAVATAPSPPTTDVTLVVTAGQGALFPAAPFNATVWPAGVQPLSTNAEIVRVTAVNVDTLTIVRTQEGTTARSIQVGDQIAANITVKTLTDAEATGNQPGSKTVAQDQVQTYEWHLKLTSADRLTLAGNGRLVLGDVAPLLPPVQGSDYAASTIIATEQFLDQLFHLKLTASERLTIQGTGRLVVTDLAQRAVIAPTKQILTVGSGTYQTPLGCTFIKVTVQAGGAGGGAAPTAASSASAGAGGGSGGILVKWIANPAATYAYTVGAKGTGGASGGTNNGNNGNDSTFGSGASLLTAKGGAGGAAMGSAATMNATAGGAGGTVATDAGSGNAILSGGQPGANGIRMSGTVAISGGGGSSRYGGGGVGVFGAGAGVNATGFGAGGSGALDKSGTGTFAGGDGTDGIILVEEFYN